MVHLWTDSNLSFISHIKPEFESIIQCQLLVERQIFLGYRGWSFALVTFDANNFAEKIFVKLKTVGIVHDCSLIVGIAQITGILPDLNIKWSAMEMVLKICSNLNQTILHYIIWLVITIVASPLFPSSKQINLVIHFDWTKTIPCARKITK